MRLYSLLFHLLGVDTMEFVGDVQLLVFIFLSEVLLEVRQNEAILLRSSWIQLPPARLDSVQK